jgi:hypothetical protein
MRHHWQVYVCVAPESADCDQDVHKTIDEGMNVFAEHTLGMILSTE